MSKIMQNLVMLMEPSEDAYETPLKGGNMIMNLFCIDEDTAFELSGVNNLKKPMSQGADPDELKGNENLPCILAILRYFDLLNFHGKLTILPKKNISIRKQLILHYKKFLKTKPKNFKYTLFMLVVIIVKMKTN